MSETQAEDGAQAVENQAPAESQQVDVPQQEVSTEDQAAQAEAEEWDAAAKEAGLKTNDKKGKQDEQTESKEDPQKDAANKVAEKKPESEEDKDPNEVETPTTQSNTVRDARAAARQSAQQAEAIKTDIREQMYADIPRSLQDADGDPINSIEDVMKLINPRTGEAFTEEEAGMWLLSAQQQFNQKLAEMDKNIEQIAELNLDLKDQADSINEKYGEYLKANPELRDKLWAQFEKTLTKDDSSGIITKMPVSLEDFYELNLADRVAAAKQANESATGTESPNADEQARQAQEAAMKKKQSRADRSDIFGGGNTDTRSDDDKEWDAAAEEVFGKRIGK